MKNLLYKEFRLALHPAAVVFLALAAMMLIPNYPLSVTFFYSCLGVFFICLNGRENKDLLYTMLLPVEKRDLVKARFGMVALLQLAQLVLCVPFCFLRGLYPPAGNVVGMDANLALLGFGLLLMGVFNLLFFRRYYKDPSKVGVPFLLGSVGVFLMVCLTEALPHFAPFFRDRLDTPLFQFALEKALFFLACGMIYALLTLLSFRSSVKSFERLDLT